MQHCVRCQKCYYISLLLSSRLVSHPVVLSRCPVVRGAALPPSCLRAPRGTACVPSSSARRRSATCAGRSILSIGHCQHSVGRRAPAAGVCLPPTNTADRPAETPTAYHRHGRNPDSVLLQTRPKPRRHTADELTFHAVVLTNAPFASWAYNARRHDVARWPPHSDTTLASNRGALLALRRDAQRLPLFPCVDIFDRRADGRHRRPGLPLWLHDSAARQCDGHLDCGAGYQRAR